MTQKTVGMFGLGQELCFDPKEVELWRAMLELVELKSNRIIPRMFCCPVCSQFIAPGARGVCLVYLEDDDRKTGSAHVFHEYHSLPEGAEVYEDDSDRADWKARVLRDVVAELVERGTHNLEDGEQYAAKKKSSRGRGSRGKRSTSGVGMKIPPAAARARTMART